MSDMLASGASGLRAYQVALSTVSENIANAGSAGYSRRTTNIKEVASIGATGAQPTGSGEGALATGVQRAGDMFKQAEVLTSGADLAKTETSVTWLDRIETSMSGSVLGTRLSSFFNSATTLAGDPTSSAARSAMLESASGVASAFSETGASLDRIAADLDTTTRDTVSSLNSLAATLAKINNGLSRTGAGTAGNAALLDQRDQVLDQMSALTDVTVDYDGAGRATVRAGGSGGPVLVDTAQASTVGYSRNAAGTISFNLMSGVDQHVLSPLGGALAGIIGGGQRDNTNLAAFAALRASGNYENKVVDMTTTNASALAQRKSVADAQTTIRNYAVASCDSLSGVDLDTEAVDLMRFQQAYAATSRVIQVARDTIQSIIDIR